MEEAERGGFTVVRSVRLEIWMECRVEGSPWRSAVWANGGKSAHIGGRVENGGEIDLEDGKTMRADQADPINRLASKLKSTMISFCDRVLFTGSLALWLGSMMWLVWL